MPTTQNICSTNPANSGEHLYGTAPRVDNWFLLEYPNHWEKEALKQSSIPKSVKLYLNRLLDDYDNPRVQLISGESDDSGTINFYFASCSEQNPKLYHFKFKDYGELLRLNLKTLSDSGELAQFQSDEKIALVCAHGRYDKCCGKYGVHIYNELKKNKKFSSWKTTHVGGHRFVSNLVMLPEGIYYGRVNGDNLYELLASHLESKIYLDCYRGRSCYTQTSQVADYFLRDQRRLLGIYDIVWEFEKDRDVYTAVEFRVKGENLVYSVNSTVFNNAMLIYPNCGDLTPKSIPQFYFYSLIPYEPKKKKE